MNTSGSVRPSHTISAVRRAREIVLEKQLRSGSPETPDQHERHHSRRSKQAAAAHQPESESMPTTLWRNRPARSWMERQPHGSSSNHAHRLALLAKGPSVLQLWLHSGACARTCRNASC
jgi:hypothetical protein